MRKLTRELPGKRTVEEWRETIKNIGLSTVEKLLDSRNDMYMMPVWDALYQRADDKKQAKDLFLLDCVVAYEWLESDRKAPREKTRHLLAVIKKIKGLIDIVKQDGRLEVLSTHAIMECYAEARGLEPYEDRSPYPSMEMILLELIDKVNIELESPASSAKPNSKSAHRVIFAKRLTGSMYGRYGQPLRAVVANTASVLFDEPIDEEFIRDNTRDYLEFSLDWWSPGTT